MTTSSSASSPTRVAFNTADGVTLRGDFYQAEGTGRPVILLTAGLTLLKEHLIDIFAKRFQAAGVSALAFDYRNYGSSDGEPRHETSLLAQAEDYRDAVSAAMRLPGVDPAKVILWGIGHGGACALIAAADDPRPKAVILQSPIVSGRNDTRNYPKGWIERAWREREERAAAGDTGRDYVQVWPESAEQARGEGAPVLLQSEAAFGLINTVLPRSRAAGTPWENKLTLRSLLHLAGTEARDFLHKIRQPTLYIVSPGDPFTGSAEYHRAAFQRMGLNGEFHVYDPPTDSGFEEFLAASIAPQVDFIRRVI